MAASIRDVARAASLSVGLVSRYLNGRVQLPQETQRRINDAVRRLEYRPHAIARRLSSGTSETLGFVTTDISYPFFAAIASAAEAEATALGYSLAIFNSRNDVECERRILSRIADRQIDGLLFLTNHTSSPELVEIINRDTRVVLIDEDVAGARAPRLFADNEGGGRLAAAHFLRHGHRSFAIIAGAEGMLSVEKRIAGFVSALCAAGIEIDPAMILKGAYSEEFGQEAFETLWKHPSPPTAVFALSDTLAVGVLRAARAAGLVIPRDLSLIGFDDMHYIDLFDPPLTTICQSPRLFGQQGVRMLVDRIRGQPIPDEPVYVPVELIERSSVARPVTGSNTRNRTRHRLTVT